MSMEETGWIAAAVAVVAWVITAARSTCSERHGRLLHRLLHQEPDGSWTYHDRHPLGGASRSRPMKYQTRRRADLSGRMLRGEDLRGVDWRDAKLVGADLSGALLNGADLSNADP